MAATGAAPRTGRFPSLAKYEVIEELGHGGMATVYRAHDRRLARDVAIKVIHPHLRDSLEVAHRFFVEAKAVAKLRHPNIVEVFDVSSEDEPEQYLVVELLRGLTLRKLLQRRGALPPEVAAALGVELLNALAHAHANGVVHRDVKPENVMIEHRPRHDRDADAIVSSGSGGSSGAISAEGTSSRPTPRAEPPGDRVLVKLTDFGIAKLLDAQGVTSTGQVLGSPAHMAPEQIEGGEVDARADVFGLGVLLYECMVGHLPFEGNNPAQVLRRVLDGTYPRAEREKPSIGKAWSSILDRALARSVVDRYSDATAMREALLAELKRVGVGASRTELEAWMDDPDSYAAAHEKRMIATLCALGEGARKRGDALAAAADYNRALAYAPHDSALHRIVSGMHRAEARRRLVRRIVPIALATLMFAVVAFFVTNALRPHVANDPNRPKLATTADPPSPSAIPSASVAVQFGPPASARAQPAPAPAPLPILHPPPVAKIERTVLVGAMRPQFGVLYAIDGEDAGEATSGLRIPIDGKAHQLTFTCVKDMCEPMIRAIEAGDTPETTIDVALSVRPALLVVDGKPELSYGIEEFPSVSVRVGVPARVPVTRGGYVVHVIERQTGRRVSATLDPGRERKASFDLGDVE